MKKSLICKLFGCSFNCIDFVSVRTHKEKNLVDITLFLLCARCQSCKDLVFKGPPGGNNQASLPYEAFNGGT